MLRGWLPWSPSSTRASRASSCYPFSLRVTRAHQVRDPAERHFSGPESTRRREVKTSLLTSCVPLAHVTVPHRLGPTLPSLVPPEASEAVWRSRGCSMYLRCPWTPAGSVHSSGGSKGFLDTLMWTPGGPSYICGEWTGGIRLHGRVCGGRSDSASARTSPLAEGCASDDVCGGHGLQLHGFVAPEPSHSERIWMALSRRCCPVTFP